MKLKECENFWVLGIFLGAVGLLSALVLAVVSDVTGPAVAAAEKRSRSAALRQLLGDFDNDPTQEKRECDGVVFMAVRKGGKLVGIAAEAETNNGYAGKIKELVGFSPEGSVIAVLVTEEKETPGLGKVVCERKFKKTIFNFFKSTPPGLPPNPILDQFAGKRAGGKELWRVKKDGGDFEFKTGATVTSRAVTELAGRAVKAFAKHRAKLAKAFPEVTK